MRLCMNSRAWKRRRIFVRTFYFLMFAWLLGISIYVAMAEEEGIPVFVPILFITVAIGLFCGFFFCDIVEGRKYCVDKNGITVSYCNCFTKNYPWHMFQRIVVCDFDHATKNPQNCFLIIRLTTLQEPSSLFCKNSQHLHSGRESWRGYFYTMFRFNKIIFLGFSPALLDEILQLSKLQATYAFTDYGKNIYNQNMQDGDWEQ